MSEMWNLWHGCHKKSEGCQHCYVFRRDVEFEKDSNVVTKTASFNLPIRRDRSGNWKVMSGTLMWTCFTSAAESWSDTLPATIVGIEKYLGSGLVKGIGPKFAKLIVQRYT